MVTEIVHFPVIIAREGKWFVASCPILDIATQGETEAEVRENIGDLIEQYMKDPDTPKPNLETLISASVTLTAVPVRKGVLRGKASSQALT